MPRSLPPTPEALERHRRACAAGQAGYLDPVTGFFVMTSVHLRAQGKCCGKGCRHCPYDADAQTASGRPDLPAYPA